MPVSPERDPDAGTGDAADSALERDREQATPEAEPSEPKTGPTPGDESSEPKVERSEDSPRVERSEDPRSQGLSAAEAADRWLRAEAEMQNYRKRVAREYEQVRRSAEEGVVVEMIPVLDDLERALDAARTEGAAPGWLQGVALVAQRMRDALARLGVEVVDPLGAPFDPAFHEAILEQPAPAGVPTGRVLQVASRGYRRGERSLRAARVVVARDGGDA